MIQRLGYERVEDIKVVTGDIYIFKNCFAETSPLSDLSFLEAPFEVLFKVIKRCCQMKCGYYKFPYKCSVNLRLWFDGRQRAGKGTVKNVN